MVKFLYMTMAFSAITEGRMPPREIGELIDGKLKLYRLKTKKVKKLKLRKANTSKGIR